MTKLYRSRTDRKITGLCGGLADTLNIDATLLRLVVVVTAFFSGGVIIPLYFLAALVIPSEPWNGGPYGPEFNYGEEEASVPGTATGRTGRAGSTAGKSGSAPRSITAERRDTAGLRRMSVMNTKANISRPDRKATRSRAAATWTI
ncbi:PspC domain-containing protein [Paenibacillus sp. P26]|nr:PspC domain-containing protein [Paenibacillus sp. P26]